MKTVANTWIDEGAGTRRLLKTALLAGQALLLSLLALFALQVLYEVIWKYRLQGPNYQMALLVVPCATYFWWLIDKTLKLVGIRRSATFTLLLSLTLTIWVVVATMHLQILDVADDATEGAWGYLEKFVRYVVSLVL